MGTSYDQAHLPFGTALNAESSATTNKKWFTSYDRSAVTGLDYAVNRTYNSKQGRFTQVDPIDMDAVDLNVPQTLNLYTYCGNDPINHTDPSGLFWGAIGRFFKKAFKWIAVALTVAVAVLTVVYAPILFASSLKLLFGVIAAVSNAASSVLNAFGLTKAGAIFGIIGAAAGFGTSVLAARSGLNWKTLLSAVSNGASTTARTLTYLGYRKLGQIFGLAASVAGFISSGFKLKNPKDAAAGFKWSPSPWSVYKFSRSAAEQIANISGATRVAGYLYTLGIVDDVGDFYNGIKDFNKNENGPKEVYRLNFLENTKRLLVGSEEANARSHYRLLSRIRNLGQEVGRVNSIIGRVQRGVALAR